MIPDPHAEQLQHLLLRDYRPQARLVGPEHHVPRAAVRAIDSHAHLGRWLSPDQCWMAPDVPRLLAEMDQCNIAGIVNLDGRWARNWPTTWPVTITPIRAGSRHAVTWTGANCLRLGSGSASLPACAPAQMRARRGSRCGKTSACTSAITVMSWCFPTTSGLPRSGRRPELGLPIFIHTADPVAFFDPVDERNERLEQLLTRPDWSFADPRFPPFQRLIDSLEALVAAHPPTTFVGVHVGCYAENLTWVGRMLDTYPNFYVDTAARLAELGRQPRVTTALIARHPSRVLFGTDEIPFDSRAYAIYFRFLQTSDEYLIMAWRIRR